MLIMLSGSESAARLRRSGARGVRSSSSPGCARSSGQGSHCWGSRPAACRMLIMLSGNKSAARLRWSRLGECNAAPLWAVPGAAGEGPTSVKTGPWLRRGMPDADQTSRQPERRSPVAERARGVRSSSPLDSGRLCPERRAKVIRLWRQARGMPDADQAILEQERRSPAAELGSARSGSAMQLPSGESGLCPEQRARVPRLWGPARGMPDADQAIQQQERSSPVAERNSGSAR
jgi:hypothetical protein